MTHPAELAPPVSVDESTRTLDSCRVCRSDRIRLLVRLKDTDSGADREFFLCDGCGSILDISNAGPDYATAPAGTADWQIETKLYLEFGAGLPAMASQLALLRAILTDRDQPTRLIDVGAGVGFLVDMAREAGFKSEGLDPSPAVDATRSLHGTTMHRCYLEDFKSEPAGALVASEVIEHVTDPDAFVANLARLLAPGGVLLLTTPNAEVLADGGRTEVSAYQRFWPGQHLTLFTPSSLQLLLARHGLGESRVIRTDGSTGAADIVIVAAREPGALPDALDWENARRRGVPLLTSYLRRKVAECDRVGRRDSVYAGAVFRLLETLTNLGQLSEADPLVVRYEAILQDASVDESMLAELTPEGFEDLIRRAPASVGHFYFYKGMLLLQQRDAASAERSFAIAAHVCGIAEAARSMTFPPGWQALARLHRGIALAELGRDADAIAEFDRVLGSGAVDRDVKLRILTEKTASLLRLDNPIGALSALLDQALTMDRLPSLDDRQFAHSAAAALVQIARRSDERSAAFADSQRSVADELRRLADSVIDAVARMPGTNNVGSGTDVVASVEIAEEPSANLETEQDSVEIREPDIDQASIVEEEAVLEAPVVTDEAALVEPTEDRPESAPLPADEQAEPADAEPSGSLADETETGSAEVATPTEVAADAPADRVTEPTRFEPARELLSRYTSPEVRTELEVEVSELRAVMAGMRAELQTLSRIAAALEVVGRDVGAPFRFVRRLRDRIRALFGRGPLAAATQPAPAPAANVPPDGPLLLAALPGATVTADGRDAAIGELLGGRVVEQEIFSDKASLSGIDVRFGLYNRDNRCHVHVEIVEPGGDIVRAATGVASGWIDNAFRRFAFEPIADSLGRRYLVRVSSPDAQSGNAVTLWCRTDLPGGLKIDGRETIGRLPCELSYVQAEAPREALKDLLIITPDVLGEIRIGLGMRHWEIANALAGRGLEVTLASTHPIADGLASDGFALDSVHGLPQKAVELAEGHRAVFVQGDVLSRYPDLGQGLANIIVDLVTPIHIENLNVGDVEFQLASQVIRDNLQRGDFFVCGNERQRLYWLGMLTSHGKVNPARTAGDRELRRLIDILGFGVPEENPVKQRAVLKGVHPGIGADDFVLMWFGGIWDWLDPLSLIEATYQAHLAEPRVKLFFSFFSQVGRQPSAMAVKARTLAETLGALDRSVFFNDHPIPHAARADYLLESDLGVICQAANFETQLSARTRVLDYFWCGLPVLMNAGDDIAEFIERQDLGIIVPTADAALLTDAILALATDPELWRRKKLNVERTRSQFHWSRMVQPVVGHLERLLNVGSRL